MSIKYCVYDHPLCDKMVEVVVTTSANKIYVSMQTTGGKHVYTVTKINPLSNLLEPNIMDFTLWLDLSPNILDSSINLWVKDMMS